MATAIYCRISRDELGDDHGVDLQQKECLAKAAQLGLTVPPALIFRESNVSAFSRKPRPRYGELINLVAAGAVDTLITRHTDRLYRNTREMIDFVELSQKTGLETHTVQAGPLDLSTPSGRATALTLGAWATYEVENKQDRIRRKQQEIAESGGIGGRRRRYGWDGYDVREDEKAIVEEMAERVLRGDSCRGIAADLTQRGVPTLTMARSLERGEAHGTSGAWSGAAVRDILERPANAALREHRGKIVGPARWPALLQEDQWRAVLETFAARSTGAATVRQTGQRWLLSGLAYCANCGSRMGTTGKSGQYRRTVYRCRGTVDLVTGKQRHCLTRKAEDLDAYVSAQVIERLSREDARDLLVHDTGRSQAAAAEAEVLRARLRREADAYLLDGSIGPDAYRHIVVGLTKRLRALEAEALPSNAKPVLQQLVGEDVQQRWLQLPVIRQAQVVDALMSVIVLPIDNKIYNKGFNPRYVRLVWHTGT